MVCSGPCIPRLSMQGMCHPHAQQRCFRCTLRKPAALWDFAGVCVLLAGQGELHWDGVSHSPGMGLGSIVSHLYHMENGNQKLPPVQKGGGCWEHLLLQSLGMLWGSQGFVDLHSHTCFSIPSLSVLPSALQAAY